MNALQRYIQNTISNPRGGVIGPPTGGGGGSYDYNGANVLFAGNSNFTGQGGDGSTTVPYQVMTMLASLGYTGMTSTNLGIGGQTTEEMIAAFSTQITPYIVPGVLNVAIMWEGINKGYYATTTKEEIVSKLEIYADMLHTAGIDLVINLEPGPRWVATSIPSGYTSQQFSDLIDSTVPLIQASTGHWDALVPIREDERIYPRYQLDVTIYHDNDGSHYKSPGKVAIAEDVVAVLEALAAPLPKLSTPSLSVVAHDGYNTVTFGTVTAGTSYTFRRATNSGFTTGVTDLNSAYPGATSPFNDTGLTNGTTYYYERIAHATGYQDSNRATANGTPEADVITDTTPPTITAAGTTGLHTVALTFDETVTGNHTGYTLYEGVTAYTPDSRTGNVLNFSEALGYGFVYTLTYDPATGNTMDAAGNELAAIVTPRSVTNNFIAPDSAISPDDITSATKVFWGSSSAPNNTLPGGNTITQLTDQFGNGNHLTNPGTAPVFHATGGWNNRPYISLSSSATLSKSSLTISQPFTLYLVCKINTGVAVANLGGSVAISIFASAFDNNGAGGPTDYSYTIGGNGGTDTFNPRTNLYDIGVQNNNVYKIHFEGAKSYVQRNRMPPTSKFDLGGGTTGMTAITLNLTGDFYDIIGYGGDVSAAEEPGLYNYIDALTPMDTHSNSLHALGDSLTVGDGTTNQRNRWAAMLAAENDLYFNSAACTGASLHHALGDFSRGLDSQVLNAIGLQNLGYVTIMIGTNNDYNKTGGGYNSTTQSQWVSDFDSMLQQLLDGGYDPDRIFVITPPYNKYMDGSGYAYYGSQADMAAFAAVQMARAAAKGVVGIDLYTESKNRIIATDWVGGMPDEIHCNDAYNANIFTYVNSFF